jgi:hypothetical protein
MLAKFEVNTCDNTNRRSGFCGRTSGIRPAQKKAAAPVANLVPRAVLVVGFFSTSLTGLWLALTDSPLAAAGAAVLAIGALVHDTMRSGSKNSAVTA